MTAPGSTAERFAFDSDERGVPPAVFSIGAHLEAQRRLRGISLAELEAVTRIPRRSLARLESGAFDQQQDAFVRGFVRTVSLAIGLDPCDVLVRMVEGDAVRGRGRPVACRPVMRWWHPALAALLVAAGATFLLAGSPDLSVPRALFARPEAAPVVRPDYVRVLAEAVRTAAPGTFGRGRPVAPPPEMLVAPAPPATPLDAILAGSGVAGPEAAAPLSPQLE